jgi:UDPglucose 6-dehydrogenase
MREAPSLVLIDLLEQAGCKIKVYDPVAMEEARRRVGDRVIYCADVYEALEDSDAMLLVTEWSEFRAINLPRINSLMRTPVIFDGRNIYDRAEMKKNKIAYFSIGRK